ncbi:hypothetical protein SUGI_0970200 [Cryptomeria japonica]|nr:hypothetical protein SUGI_0970200 [Cryptomeria japonica]
MVTIFCDLIRRVGCQLPDVPHTYSQHERLSNGEHKFRPFYSITLTNGKPSHHVQKIDSCLEDRKISGRQVMLLTSASGYVLHDFGNNTLSLAFSGSLEPTAIRQAEIKFGLFVAALLRVTQQSIDHMNGVDTDITMELADLDFNKYLVTVLHHACAVVNLITVNNMEPGNKLIASLKPAVKLSPNRPFGYYLFCSKEGGLFVAAHPILFLG